MTDPAPRRSGVTGTALLVGLVLTAGGSVGGLLYWRKERLKRNEMNAAAALKVIATAEADFRSNDRDGNRVNDFWTGDVAGLYYLGMPMGNGRSQSMQLIQETMARADDSRPDRIPFHGYFFRAMDLDETGAPYRENTTGDPTHGKLRNLSRFAFCAYPANYPSSGRWTYIVNEGNGIFKMDTDGKPMAAWPRDRAAERSYRGD